MGERLIDDSPNLGKVVIIIPSAEDWESIKTALSDELFVDWIKYVVPVVLPRSVGDATRGALVNAALRDCKEESRIQFILPSRARGHRDEFLPFAVWVKKKFDEQFGTDIDSETVGFKTPQKAVKKILERLSKYKFKELDKKLLDGLSISQTMRIKPWLAQWASISAEMGQVGEQVLRNVWYVKMPPLLDRIRSAWIDESRPCTADCPTVVFFEEDSHDSNTALIDGLLNRYESVLGKELKVLWVSKQWTYDVYAKPNHRRSKSHNLSLLDATELILLDECNISGHKAYGRDRNSSQSSQLDKMKILADKIVEVSGKSCSYRLWFAYSTNIALRFKENTMKFDLDFCDARFVGIEASHEDDFLRGVSKDSPMAFDGMTKDQIDRATAFAERFPSVASAIKDGSVKGLRDWKGGYLTSFFLPASKPGDNYPPLIHHADWSTVTGKECVNRRLWMPLFARNSNVASTAE